MANRYYASVLKRRWKNFFLSLRRPRRRDLSQEPISQANKFGIDREPQEEYIDDGVHRQRDF